jgi:hypothetical protein
VNDVIDDDVDDDDVGDGGAGGGPRDDGEGDGEGEGEGIDDDGVIDERRGERKVVPPVELMKPDADMECPGSAAAEEPAKPAKPTTAPQDSAAEAVSIDFLIALLAAVARMAMRSSRRQADLQTAMRADRLRATPARMMAGIRHLERMGYVRGLLELGDGGILLTVTTDGFERLRLTSFRDIVEGGGA